MYQSSGDTVSLNEGLLARRFRLAGTFFWEEEEGGEGFRKAVLDDLSPSGIQHIVSEADEIDGIQVVSIFRDRIMLSGPAGTETLWLIFSRGKAGDEGTDGKGTGDADIVGPDAKFGGKQIGEHRWIFKRDALIDYYAELMDEPERLLKVFDSLDPVDANGKIIEQYDPRKHKIDGYKLGIEGEADFFSAAGLKEGDVLHSVNHMRMTNRRRAEHFINEFVKDRANTFVLEVERGGKEQEFIYQVR
ncbi:hypothetical protein ACFLS1_07785 [Verrucomicrobiota bacterium]